MEAATAGHTDVVKFLLDRGAAVDMKPNSSGWPALTFAAKEGHLDAVKLLLDRGADAAVTMIGEPTFMVAAGLGNSEVLKVFRDHMADVDARRKFGEVALRAAAYRGNADVVKLLLEKGIDVNAKEITGGTALIGAAAKGHLGLVKLLLERGADVNAREQHPGTGTALESAARNRHTDVVNLLKAHGAEVTLPIAAMLGDEREAERLIGSGRDVNAKDQWGSTVLIDEASNGHADAVRLLLEKGAEVDGKGRILWKDGPHVRCRGGPEMIRTVAGGPALSWSVCHSLNSTL